MDMTEDMLREEIENLEGQVKKLQADLMVSRNKHAVAEFWQYHYMMVVEEYAKQLGFLDQDEGDTSDG